MSAIRVDLGHRVELVAMDPHYEDIAVGLYVRESGRGPVGSVHSYSRHPGTAARLAAIAQTMRELGGLEAGADVEVRFACGTWHHAAAKRLFIEAVKHDPATLGQASPLQATDARSGQRIEVVPRGVYCGAVGWVDGDRGLGALNVAIRTFWFDEGMIHLGTGGAITWDSTPQGEWEETELKARHLCRVAVGETRP